MRLILFFIIGLVGFFYLGEISNRIFKKSPHSIIGLILILTGFLIGFWGKSYFGQPLNSLISVFLLGSGLGFTSHHLLSRRYIVSERIEKSFIKKHETIFERILEILPGALTWIALTSPFWLSFTLPFAVAYLILIADIYWLFNSLKIASLIFIGYKKYSFAKKTALV